MVAAGLVDHSFTQELVGGPGDTMNVKYISNPSASTKSANTNISFEVVGPSGAEASQSFTVATHQYAAVALEAITEVQSETDLIAKYSGKAAYVLAAAADTNLHTLPQNFSRTIGTLGVEPTDDNLLECSRRLDDALAPRKGRFMIFRPATYHAILKIDKFVNSDYVGDAGANDAIRDAHVGKIYGFEVYETTLVRAPAGGQAENWACHPLGVYYCSQKNLSHFQYIIERGSEGMLSEHIYGYAEALQPPITAGGGAATDVFNAVLYGTS